MQVSSGGAVTWRSDDVSTEEPLEIRVGSTSLSVTMRTPGEDFDLVAGFLITEGIISGANEIDVMRMCPDATAASGELNLLVWALRQGQHRSRAHEVAVVGARRPVACGAAGPPGPAPDAA